MSLIQLIMPYIFYALLMYGIWSRTLGLSLKYKIVFTIIMISLPIVVIIKDNLEDYMSKRNELKFPIN